LHDEHVAAGARMVDFAGWKMPVQYESIIDEHRAVREAAGLFDVSHMGEVAIEGEAAERCCRTLFTNDAARLVAGRAHYSLIPNERGGVVDDVIVYRLASDRFFVCVNASNIEKDYQWIRSRAPQSTEACRVTDRSDETSLLAVQGPAALAVLARCGAGLEAVARFAVERVRVGKVDVLAARTGYTGEDGFELFAGAGDAVELWRTLLDAGRDLGLRPAGLGARDTLRLEAALPLYGHEIDDDTSPFEVGLAWVVKLNRPEMVGYRALVEAREGGATRRLIGIEIEAGIARHGCAVLACGVEIGRVTSGSYCPSVGKAVAMALVDGASARSELEVDVRGRRRPAHEVKLPFYVRGKSA
jgi:aminomethyltransferase